MSVLLLLAACTSQLPTVRERFGDAPFLTPRDAPADVGLLAGGTVPADPATCGACHTAVYAEWQATTHAAAATDLQFLAELSKPTSPRWLCLNCHVPTQPQRPDLVTLDTRFAGADSVVALVATPNPAFVPARATEGIGCATCHVRRDADGVGLVIGPRETDQSPHRVRVDRAALDGICVQCHSPGAFTFTPQLWCWFQTGDELAAGPDAGKACVDCHMPEVERPVTATSPPRLTRRHHWVGGGVPKSYDGYAALLDRGFAPGVGVTVSAEAGRLRIHLTNTAGHALPTADPERYLRVSVVTERADGSTAPPVLRRIGQRWDWGDAERGTPARRVTDERVPAGGALDWGVDLPAGTVAATVEVANVRLNPATVPWMRTVSPSPEARALRPGVDFSVIDELYPLGTLVWRGRWTAATGAVDVTPLADLVAESAALATAPLAEKAARFGAD